MLTHVVMARLQDMSEGPRLADLLNGLNGRIPGMRSMSAGTNVVPSDRAYDLCLVAVFDDLAAMHAYQGHPAHVEAATELRAAATEIVASDFES